MPLFGPGSDHCCGRDLGELLPSMINQFTKSAASLIYSPVERLGTNAMRLCVGSMSSKDLAGKAIYWRRMPGNTLIIQAVARALCKVRDEYTSLPRFGYHLPLDYNKQTLPPRFNSPVFVDGEAPPHLPPNAERHGHAISDAEYLEWGRYEKEIIPEFMRDTLPSLDNLAIMDFGCSFGRILRHFYDYSGQRNWKLVGVDVSARRIEWMRRDFPKRSKFLREPSFRFTFQSNSFDAIYGMSVFTHIKYLWDTSLFKLRQVLKPGGVLIQSIHTEHAWCFFAEHREEDWARDALGPMLVEHLEMPADFVYFRRSGQEPGFLERRNRCRFLGKIFWRRRLGAGDIVIRTG